MKKPLTGEPFAEKPPVRIAGWSGESPPRPVSGATTVVSAAGLRVLLQLLGQVPAVHAQHGQRHDAGMTEQVETLGNKVMCWLPTKQCYTYSIALQSREQP